MIYAKGHPGWGMVVGLALVSAATGCKKVTKLIGEQAGEQLKVAGEALGSDARSDAGSGSVSGQEAATMGQYANGYNTLIDDPKECLTEYFDDVPMEGPQKGQKYRFFPAHTRGSIELAKVKKSFESAKSSAPKQLQHLAPLAAAAVADVEKACSTFEEVQKYYDAEDYLDDQGKRGQALHAKMVEIAKSAQDDLQTFEDALSEVEDRQSKAEIAKYENDKSYGYWFRIYNFQAKKLLGVSDAQKFQAQFDDLEKSHAGLKSFSDQKGDSLHASFKAYLGQADRYHSTAKKMLRAVSDQNGKPQQVAQLDQQLTSGYNSLVSVGNSLRELEGYNLLK